WPVCAARLPRHEWRAGAVAGLCRSRLLSVRQRSSRPAARAVGHAAGPVLHNRGVRCDRVAEPGSDGQHVRLRVEPLNTPVVRAMLRMLAIGYPVALLIFIVSLRFVGEKWWGTTIALYLPRAPFALPLLPLVVAIVWLGPRKLLWTQLLAFGLLFEL